MEHLLCARLVAVDKVVNNRGTLPAFRELPIQQEKADVMQINTQRVVSYQLSYILRRKSTVKNDNE